MHDTPIETTTSVARSLAVCEQTVRNLVRRGELPAIRTASGHLLFRSTDVARIAEALKERRGR
jgi:excisionase family DNA binding protein